MSKVRSDLGIEKFYRVISKYFVKKIQNTNITPNILSWISFILILCAIPFIIFSDNNYFNIISFFLINLSLIMDCADGDLAIEKNMQSQFGGHLDCTLDRLTDYLFILSITISSFLSEGNEIYLIFGLIFVGFRFCIDNVYFSMIVFLPNFKKNNLNANKLMSFIEYFIFTRTIMLFLGSIFLLFNLQKEYLVIMSVYVFLYYFAILIFTYLKSYDNY